MAIQVESPAQLSEIRAVFGRRRWWLYVPLLFALGMGALVAVLLPRKYEVETQVKLLEVRYNDDQHFRTKGAQGALERNLVNAEYDIKEPSRINRLIDELAWVDFAELDALEKEDYVKMVQRNIEVEVLAKAKDEGASYLELRYRDIFADRAETFLRTLTVLYINETFGIDKDEIAAKVKAQRALVEANENALDQMRTARREKIDANGMPFDSTIRTREGLNGDNVYNRLKDAEDEVVRLQIERLEREAARDAIKADFDTRQSYVLRSSLSAPVSNDDGLLATYLAEVERIDTALENMRPGHLQFEKYRADRAKIQALIDARSGGTAAQQIQERVVNPEREALLLMLNDAERAIGLLDVRVAALQKQIEVDRRLALGRTLAAQDLDELETNIRDEEQILGQRRVELAGLENDLASLLQLGASYEITKEPLAPTDPVEPNVPLVMIGATVFGALLGLVLVLAREYLVVGFRIASDVGSDIAVPILGIVGQVTTRRQRNARRVLASATGLSTVLFLGLVAWFVFTWQNQKDILGSDLVERIEKVQYSLR